MRNRSSRQIERLCVSDVAYRVLCAPRRADHCTIARFRPDCQNAFKSLFRQVLLIVAQAGLGNFGTVAIDGTKICANASIDANRGGDWLAEQVSAMVAEAEHADAAEAHGRERVDGDRVPAGLGERCGRLQRIRQAAEQVSAQMRREQQEQDEKTAAAKTRRDKSEAGQPVRGRIPAGPHRLAEAQAHLAREIAMHQAKLDRRAALIAAGRKPMGDGRAWRAGARRAAAPCFQTSPVRVCAYHGVEAGRGHRPLAETRDAEAMSVATDL